jgi:hypothetical protein
MVQSSKDISIIKKETEKVVEFVKQTEKIIKETDDFIKKLEETEMIAFINQLIKNLQAK